MALAVVKSTPDAAPPSLADRLADAQRAEVRPRNRVAELSAGFDVAVREQRFTDADRLQGELAAAREALAVAEGTTSGFRAAMTAIEQVHAAETRALDEARRDAECQRVIEEALAADRHAQDEIEAALADMRASLGAARNALMRATQWEDQTWSARTRAAEARARLAGETAFGKVSKANRASVLTERDPLVRELMRWDGSWNT